MLSALHRQRGMNLVEILIAVAILAMLMTLGMPMYATWLQSSQIRTAAEGLSSGLQFARTEAVSRNVPGGVTFQVNGNNWTVFPTNNAGEILRQRAGERSPNAAIGVTPAGATSVVFNSFGRVTSPVLGAGEVATFAVTNPTGGACIDSSGDMRCLNVTLTASGAIRMCDRAKPAGDAQAC